MANTAIPPYTYLDIHTLPQRKFPPWLLCQQENPPDDSASEQISLPHDDNAAANVLHTLSPNIDRRFEDMRHIHNLYQIHSHAVYNMLYFHILSFLKHFLSHKY